MWQTFDRNSFFNDTILYSFEKMEFLIPVIPLDKRSVILKTPILSTALNRKNENLYSSRYQACALSES